MTKADYLAALKQLAPLPPGEIEDILRDQEEYIRDALSAGRSEAEVLAGLGEPRVFAQSLTANFRISQAERSPTMKLKITGTLRAIAAILALAPLTFFFVLGPFFVSLFLLAGGWLAAAGLFLAALASLAVFFMEAIFLSGGFWTHFSTFFFLLGSLGLTVLVIAFMAKASQWFVLGTLAYLKWNLRFVQARA